MAQCLHQQALKYHPPQYVSGNSLLLHPNYIKLQSGISKGVWFNNLFKQKGPLPIVRIANVDTCPKVWYILCITAAGIAVKSSDYDLPNTRFVKQGKFFIEWSKNSLYKPPPSALCSLAQIMLISDSKKYIFCLNNTSQNFEGFRCTRTLVQFLSNSWKILHELTIISLSSQLHGLLSLSELLHDTILWYTSGKNLFTSSSP